MSKKRVKNRRSSTESARDLTFPPMDLTQDVDVDDDSRKGHGPTVPVPGKAKVKHREIGYILEHKAREAEIGLAMKHKEKERSL